MSDRLSALFSEYVRRMALAATPAVFSVSAFAKSFPKIWSGVLAKLNLQPNETSKLRYIKSGSKGSAYRLGNEVVKFTTDKTEIEAMARIANSVAAGKKPKYLVNVSKVFTFPYGEAKIGCIRQELLQPGAKDWKDFGEVASFYFYVVLGGVAFDPRGVDQFKYWAVRRFSKIVQGDYALAADEPAPRPTTKVGRPPRKTPLKTDPEAEEAFKRAKEQNLYFREVNPDAPWGEYVDKSAKMPTEEMFEWFRGLCKELQAYKIGFYDLNAGNMMQRNGEHVVIDLGFSRVEGAVTIDDELMNVAVGMERAAALIESMYKVIR